MVVYPGNRRPVYEWLGRDNSEGYNLTYLQMIVHTGTHIDSPLHFIPGGLTIDKVDLGRLHGSTKVFSCRKEPQSVMVYPEDIMDSTDELEKGSIFVLRTGIEDYGETSEYNFRYPYPSPELVDLLLEKEIRSYMTDATSIDPYGSESSPNHKQILGAGIPIVENLCHLKQLVGLPSFIISALPLSLEGREGSPCRAVAILSD